MTSIAAETSTPATVRPRWRTALWVVGLAIVLAELEVLQNWMEHRGDWSHDRFLWTAWAMVPPWLLMAALVPAIAWLCRRFPLAAGRFDSFGVHAASALLFPVVHLGGLALLYRLFYLNDPMPLAQRISELLAFHYVFDVLAYGAIAAVVHFLRRSQASAPAEARAPLSQIVVKDGAATRLVPVESIEWIEARSYYARLHTTSGRVLVRESLSSLEKRLDPSRFARIHRSTIVGLSHVAEVRPRDGRQVVVLRSGLELTASRQRGSSLKARMVNGEWRMAKAVLALLVFLHSPFAIRHSPLLAQGTRLWRPEERTLLTDLSNVTAVAATRRVVYAATPAGLAVYDRGLLAWKHTLGPLDRFPNGIVTAMVADPNDETAYLAMGSTWVSYDPFSRRVESGPLPGGVDQVVLDARDPGRGAYYHTFAGWYFLQRGGFAAMPAQPPAARLGGMSARELIASLPSFDAVRLRVERDEQLRSWRMTSAVAAPLTREVYIGTAGNGTFRVDPVSYAVDRLPAGLLGTATGAIAASRGQVCAAGEARADSPHHGLVCFDETLSSFNYYESMGLATLPTGRVRRVLVTERAVWAATDQGLVHAPRRGGRPTWLLTRDGLPSDQVLSLVAFGNGALVGTSAGIALVADTGRSVVVESSARGPAVLALAAPGSDTIWAGTSAGIVGFLLPLGGPVAVPIGPASTHDVIVAIVQRHDSLIAATESRFLVRAADTWQVIEQPGHPVGRIASVVSDDAGLWVSGDQGFAFYDPSRSAWFPLVSPDDVPQPVRDIAVTRGYVWVATEQGVVRYAKRLVMP